MTTTVSPILIHDFSQFGIYPEFVEMPYNLDVKFQEKASLLVKAYVHILRQYLYLTDLTFY